MIKVEKLLVKKSGKPILEAGSFEIAAKEKVVIAGANGSGKTTLLRVLSGLETEFQGRFERTCPMNELTMVHQNPFMIRGSARSNLFYGLKCHKYSEEESEHRIQHWSAQIGIQNILAQNARSLSGGERKKVAIARALVLEPKLLFLDEPLAELDTKSEDNVTQLLLGLTDTTVVLTSPSKCDGFDGVRKIFMEELVQTRS